MSSANSSRRFPYGWIILLLVLALLYATNPSEAQFTSYLKDKIHEQADGDETLSGDLQRMLAGPAASLAGMGTVRTNYYLCSVYHMDLPGEDQLYLGMLDHFLRLK